MSKKKYNFEEVEEVVKQVLNSLQLSPKSPVILTEASPNLDNSIQQGEEGAEMPSNHRETYYYADKNGKVASIRIAGLSKMDTDQKFLMYLQSRQKDISTLKDFVENTYKPRFMRKLSPTTVSNYTNYLDRYILPVLGSKQLDEISVTDIQDLYDWLANAESHGCRNNLNSDTITRVSGLLGRIFKIAVDMEMIKSSPIKKTLLSNDGNHAAHHKPLPDQDVSRIKAKIPYLPTEQQRLYMGLLVYTGMRREEIVGLEWKHIHLDEGYGHIEQVVVYPDGKSGVLRDRTKTKYSTRDFIIPKALDDILRPCQQKSGFIIHGKDPSKPVAISTLKRLYSSAFENLGISGYNNHDWRTTFGTQLKEAGVTSAQLADLMGHADTRMVETTYAVARHDGIMKHRETLEMLNARE